MAKKYSDQEIGKEQEDGLLENPPQNFEEDDEDLLVDTLSSSDDDY